MKKNHLVRIIYIEKFKSNMVQEKDVLLWMNDKGKYKRRFSIKVTWLSIRENAPACYLHQAVWFKNATPRFSFITWVALRGRLSTGDRMQSWSANVNTSCMLCQESVETRNHLFFECSYTEQVWRVLMRGVMGDQYSAEWGSLLRLMTRDSSWSKMKLFTVRYNLSVDNTHDLV
ncbi:hypothetical protein Bca101_083057 [Brassica carinata]